jgi:predicted O-methyltransferase YrrM
MATVLSRILRLKPASGHEHYLNRVLPAEFTANLPDWLRDACEPAEAAELNRAQEIRRRFLFPGKREPWIADVVRAFRLVRGQRRYVEVGTYDKGNLAFVSTLLAPDALMIDVDIKANEAQAAKLREFVAPSQRIRTVVGDSTRRDTLAQVTAALDGEQADAVFIDGNHLADYALADYAAYSRLLRPGGLVLMHDVYWPGFWWVPGTVHAVREIDRLTPVYVVRGAHDPVHRFLPPRDRTALWGCVAMIRPENGSGGRP